MRMSIIAFFFIVILNEISCFDLEKLIQVDPDTFRNVSELISSKGYPVEEYTVLTPDGYLLAVQRIPHGKQNSSNSGQNQVVLLVNGLAETTAVYVWNNETQSLGYLLADNGYDVWLGNTRGNTLSRYNVRISPSQNEFWDFSFDELAKYDLPSMIDFVLHKTGQTQISYIGNAESTTAGFALLSRSPLYNKKIKIFIAMSPVTHTIHTGGLLGLGIPFILSIQPVYKEIGLVELFPHTGLTERLAVLGCGTPLRFICSSLLFSLYGYDSKQLNYTRLPVYFNHIPAGTSTKEYIHYAQMKYSKKFQMYDYYDRNTEIYNQSTPPEYDISKITTPIALMSAANDLIADPLDVSITQAKLKSVVDSYVVPFDDFNHGDFTMAIDAYNLVNKKIISYLELYGRN